MNRTYRKLSRWVLGGLLIALPLGATPPQFYYIVNDTSYYLHVKADERMYYFLAPGDELEIEDDGDLRARVFYSPGQPVTGYATRDLRGYDDEATDCDESRTVPADAVTWVVEADDLHND